VSADSANRVAVSAVRAGDRVKTVLLVLDKRAQTTRSGKPYLSLMLGDRTGSMQARVWDDAERYGALFEAGDFVFVDALPETFNGQLQLKVNHLERVSSQAVDTRDFQAASKFDPDEMADGLKQLIASEVKSPEVRRFIEAVLDDSEIKAGLERAPAAKGNHHAYLAGLLEHTLSMTRLAVAIGRHYEAYYEGLLDTDLLIAGTVLHDIGKIWELSSDLKIDYTTEGRLVGHIVMGTELITRVLAQLDIRDAELGLRLKHLVLSHHGKQEYGAVVEPMTPEAQVLHFIDQIDSRMNMFASAVEGAEGAWSTWVRPLGGFVFAGAQEPVVAKKGAPKAKLKAKPKAAPEPTAPVAAPAAEMPAMPELPPMPAMPEPPPPADEYPTGAEPVAPPPISLEPSPPEPVPSPKRKPKKAIEQEDETPPQDDFTIDLFG